MDTSDVSGVLLNKTDPNTYYNPVRVQLAENVAVVTDGTRLNISANDLGQKKEINEINEEPSMKENVYYKVEALYGILYI